jgi:ABC-type amino acid transport substrate-binding protein
MNLSVRILLIFFCLLAPLSEAADKGNTLIVGYGDHNAPPYAIEMSEKLQSGIIKDIATELSDELDISVSFFKTPRKRTERYLENNTIHLYLISNPAWLDNSDKLQWSTPLFIDKDILVVREDNPKKYQEMADFRRMIIGTIRGYSYPELQPFFDKEFFIRYDVSSLDVNFIRIELNRIDALVDSEILINYHLKQSNNAHLYRKSPLTVSQQNIQAALSPNAPITLIQLNQALKKLKDQGVIAAILKKYQIEDNSPQKSQ